MKSCSNYGLAWNKSLQYNCSWPATWHLTFKINGVPSTCLGHLHVKFYDLSWREPQIMVHNAFVCIFLRQWPWRLTSKRSRVLDPIWEMYLQLYQCTSRYKADQTVIPYFYCDIDLWHLPSKIIRVLSFAWVMYMRIYMNVGIQLLKLWPGMDFHMLRLLWPWPLTPIINSVLAFVWVI